MNDEIERDDEGFAVICTVSVHEDRGDVRVRAAQWLSMLPDDEGARMLGIAATHLRNMVDSMRERGAKLDS